MSVLICGATSPIARQLAHRFAEAGHAVFVAARDSEEAERIAADLRVRRGVVSASAHFDALDFDGHAAFVDEVEARVGPIEVLVAAFGEMGDQTRSEDDFEAARRVIEVNFTGAASICEAVASRMITRGMGSVIGIGSVAGDRGRKSNYFYGAAKGAFSLYLQGLRNRGFEHGVHVMCVKLGFVDTRMTFGMQTGIPIASPEKVSRALFKAWRRKADSFYYPPFWAGIMGIIRAIPEPIFKRLSL